MKTHHKSDLLYSLRCIATEGERKHNSSSPGIYTISLAEYIFCMYICICNVCMFDSLVYRGSGPFVSPIHPNAVGRTLANEPRMRVYNIQIGIYKQHSDMQITFIVECLSYTS